MKRTAKTALALLLTAGLAVSGYSFSGSDGESIMYGGSSGCCRNSA